MTWISGATCRAIRCAAPLCEWRTTNMSACIAHRLSTVSSKLSPLLVEDDPMFRLTTSADRRLAAISNVVRVRVLFSKKILNTDLPCSSGTFLISRPSATSRKEAARSRMSRRMRTGSPSVVNRCWSSPFLLSCGFFMYTSVGTYDYTCGWLIKIGLQNLLRGILVNQTLLLAASYAFLVQLFTGSQRGVALIHQDRSQAEPPLKAIGEAAAQRSQFVRRSVIVAGLSHQQRTGLPFLDERCDRREANIVFLFGYGDQGSPTGGKRGAA